MTQPPPDGHYGKERVGPRQHVNPPTREFYAGESALHASLLNLLQDLEKAMIIPPNQDRLSLMGVRQQLLAERIIYDVFEGQRFDQGEFGARLLIDVVNLNKIPVAKDLQGEIAKTAINIDFLKQPAQDLWGEFERHQLSPRARLEYVKALVLQMMESEGEIAPNFWNVLPIMQEFSEGVIEEEHVDGETYRRGVISARADDMSPPVRAFFYFVAWQNIMRACYYAIGELPQAPNVFELNLE